MKKLLKTYLWVSISSCLFSDAAFAQTAKIANDLDSLAGFHVGEFGIAERAGHAAAIVPKELTSLDTGAGLILAPARSAQADGFPDVAVSARSGTGSHGLFEASVLAASASRNAVTFNQIFHFDPASTAPDNVPTDLRSTVQSSAQIPDTDSPTAIDDGSLLRLASLPVNVRENAPSATANTRRIQKFAGALAGGQATEDDSASSSEPQLRSLPSAGFTRDSSLAGLRTTSYVGGATATSQVVQISGNGTAANPFILSGSGDITSYILQNQYVQLSGGGAFSITIPQTSTLPGNNLLASPTSVDPYLTRPTNNGYSASLNPTINYTGIISGTGSIEVQSGFNPTHSSPISLFNGGVLIFNNNGQTWGLPGSSGGTNTSALTIDSNVTVDFTHVSGGPVPQNGDAFSSSSTIDRNVINNGYLYTSQDNNWASINGRGVNVFQFDAGLNNISGGLTSGSSYSGQLFDFNNGTTIEFGAKFSSDTVLESTDITVLRTDSNSQALTQESKLSYGGYLTIKNPFYFQALDWQTFGVGIVDFTNLLLPPQFNNGNLDLAPPDISALASYSYGSGTNQGFGRRIYQVSQSSLVFGDGEAISADPLDPSGKINNFFLQGNPANTQLSTNDFGGVVGPLAQGLGLDYSGTYTVNFNLNQSVAFNKDGSLVITDPRNAITYNLFLLDPNDPLFNPAGGATLPNHAIITVPAFFGGLTRIDNNTVLQLGDGTQGNDVIKTITPPASVVGSNGQPYAAYTSRYNDSNGNGLLMTRGNIGVFSDVASVTSQAAAISFQIVNNGQIIVDNTIGARDGVSTGTSPGASAEVAAFINSNELDNITGTGSLLQMGTLALTLEGNTIYSGETDVAANSALYLKSNPATGATGLPNSVLNLQASGASFDVSQADAVNALAGLSGVSGSNVFLGNTNLTINAPTTSLFAGMIQDGGIAGGIGGSLTKTGNGTLTLAGDNTYTGMTTIAAGTLQLGNGETSGTVAGNITDSGTLAFDRADTVTYGGVISGNGNLTQIGNGTTVLAADQTYTGTTTVTAGTLQLGNGTTTGSVSGNIIDQGTVSFDRADVNVLNNLIGGTGGVTQVGSGTTVFTADQTFTGGSTITSGTLQLGNGGTTGSIAGNVIDNATLVFNRADAVTFDGIISGTGQLIEQGPGNLLLTADNPFTGTTTIHTGTLQLGNGGTSGNLAGNIVDSTALIFDRSDSVTYGGTISGDGTLSQNGSGTLVLDGTSSFTGGTSVATGTLLVGDSTHGSAAIAGDVSVASGATLSGHGLIGGNVTIAGGAHLAPGDSIATLSIGGDLDVAQGGLLDDEFGKPNAVPTTPGSSDQVNVAGNLTLNGAILNVTADTGFGEGLYTLFNYGGTLTETNGGILFGAVPANDNLSIQTLTGSKQINLLDVPTGTLNFWNGNGLASPTQLGGGDGAWSLTAFNWSNAAGTLTGPMQPVPGLAIFAGAAGTVTVDNSTGAVSATGLQFATDGYVLNGGTLTLVADTGGNAPSIRVGDGTAAGASDVATVANVLAGTAGLVKTDYGILVLTAANTYTGGTTINAGTLQLGNGGSTGAILGDVVDNGTFAFDHADALSFGAVVSGIGGLTQQGSDTLTLTGANSYTGPTTISAGTLALGATGSIANSSSVIDNSTFDISNALNGASIVSLAGNGTVNLGAQALALTNAADTFAGVIAGTGSLTLVSGEQILTGSNTYTGGTTISGGTLQLGNGGASGSVTGDIADNGTVAFDRSDITTISQAISGSGGVRQAGAGTTILAGNDSYTGSTEVASGDLQVDSTLSSDALVDAGGTLSGTGQVAGLTVNGNLLIGDATAAAKVFNAAHNVVFNPGSQFQVYVDPSGAHSLLQVAGSTVLNGGNVSVSAASGSYGVNQSYEILQATGGVSGTFNGVLVTDIDLAPTLQYQPNGVFLVLDTTPVGGGAGGNGGGTPGPQPIALFPCAQLTANQCATEHALQAISLQPPAALLPTLNALVTQTLPQARVSLDGLNGQIFADANMAALRQMGGLRALIDNRASQPGDGTIWFQAHSDDATLGNPSQTLSASVDNQGSYAGIQRPIDDRLQLGAFVGDTRTNLNLSNGDHARLSTPQFGLYMTGVFGPNDAWYGNGSFGYGHPQVRTTRYVRVVDSTAETSIAAYSQNLAALSLELGYHGLFGQTHLDPFLAYDGAHVKRGLTNENSDQPLDLTVQGRSMVSSLVSGGVHLSRDVTTDAGTVVPELTLAVARQQGDLQGTADTAFQAAPGIDFQTDGARTGRLLETVSGGVSAHLDHGWTASLDATYTHASHENDRGLQAKLALNF